MVGCSRRGSDEAKWVKWFKLRIEGVDLPVKDNMTFQNTQIFALKVLLRRFRVVAAKVARQLNCGGVARVSWAFASMAESEGCKMVEGEDRLIQTDPLI